MLVKQPVAPLSLSQSHSDRVIAKSWRDSMYSQVEPFVQWLTNLRVRLLVLVDIHVPTPL
jgi:hypothetical protein